MSLSKKTSVENELKFALSYLREFEKKKKTLLSHRLSIRYCDKMIPFLKGRVSGLTFAKSRRSR